MPTKKRTSHQKSTIRNIGSAAKAWWKKSHWHKFVAVLLAALILFTGSMYGIAQWYIHDQSKKPLKYGVTFIPTYAEQLGVDPKETMQAFIDDLGIRQFRLVSYWTVGEPEPGQYDFSALDWQMKKAEESGSKVSLAIGLRQPRWPECHMPDWAARLTKEEWSVQLKEYMRRVIERYKDSPALESYQLENEFFMTVFGICPDFTRDRLVDEYNFVKGLDPHHPVIVSRSNNWVGIPYNEPSPDITAISVYKRVWDKTITKRYFEYPLPAWFYASLGGVGKIVTGKDLIIHELQAEAWLPDGYRMNDVNDIEEQNKSLTPERLQGRFEYGRDTGLREIYLWGAEWWYWRKQIAHDPSLWNVAKEEFSKQ